MSWEDIIKKRELAYFKRAQKYLESVEKNIDTAMSLLKEENGGWKRNRNELMYLLDNTYIIRDFENELDMLLNLIKKVEDKATQLGKMPERDEFDFVLENERAETESGYYDPRNIGMQ